MRSVGHYFANKPVFFHVYSILHCKNCVYVCVYDMFQILLPL